MIKILREARPPFTTPLIKRKVKTSVSDQTWEHFDDLRRLDCGAVEDPCRVNPQPGHNPGHSKTGKKNVAGTLVVGVLTHLGRLKRTNQSL